MKAHRVREIPATDKDPAPHRMLELERDKWINVHGMALEQGDHNRIHTLLTEIKAGERSIICYNDKLFSNEIAKGWVERTPIIDKGSVVENVPELMKVKKALDGSQKTPDEWDHRYHLLGAFENTILFRELFREHETEARACAQQLLGELAQAISLGFDGSKKHITEAYKLLEKQWLPPRGQPFQPNYFEGDE